MIGKGYHHDGAKPLLIAPPSKYRAFVLCARYVDGNLLDIHTRQRLQFSSVSGGPVFVWDTATGELSFRSIPSVGEDCDSAGHAAVNKIGSLKHSSSIGFAGNDDDVSGPDALIHNECPSGEPQNRMSYRRHSNAGNGQGHEHQHDSTSQPITNHCLDNT